MLGRTRSVRRVDVTNPPITTVAKGRCTSAPMLVATAIGTKPNPATIAVISTGRSRVFAPSTTASSSERSSCRSRVMVETSTTPFSTAIPDRAIKPTAAEMLKGSPQRAKAKTPPVIASGVLRKMSRAGRSASKLA